MEPPQEKEFFMSKHYVSKSALALSLCGLASIGAIVSADEPVESNSTPTPMTTVAPTTASDQNSSSSNTDNASSKIPSLSDEATDFNSTPNPETSVVPTTSSNTDEVPVTEQTIPVTDAEMTAATPAATSENKETAKSESSDLKPIEGENVDLQILSTTDLHTNLVNYDYYQDKASQKLGLAKTAVLIDKAKAENPNTVLVDNGDIIQGTPLGTYKAIIDPVKPGEEHPMYAALNKLGFDASTLGNHEFNYGLDFLKSLLTTANLPVVNANVLDAQTKQNIFKPYEILTKTFTDTSGRSVAVNIGITGIVPPQILNWDKANLDGKVTVTDSVKAVKSVLPVMREKGADLILVLSHSGIGDDKYQEGEENVGYQIASLDGVDAVVTGHSHAEFPTEKGDSAYEKLAGADGANGKINGTPVTMAGKYGDHLGVIKLSITYKDGKWQVVKSKGEIRKIDSNSTEANQDIITLAKDAHEGTIKYVRQQVGVTTAPITSYFALVKDDPSVQIVNNAQIWYIKNQLKGTPEAKLPLLSAAAPFKAGTRNDPTAYTDIPAGPIAIKNVADLYLYDNVTAILKITGADLKEWLEMSAGQFNQIDPQKTGPQNLINTDYRTYNFDVIDGVTYQFDVTQPNKYDKDGNLVNPQASRVRNLKYLGKEVTDAQEFIVATNNYRASGNFPGVKQATINRLLNLENRQAIIDYIVSEKVINPSADNNWGFTNSIKGLDIRFQTADKAKLLLKGSQDIHYLSPSAKADGFGDFQFIYTEPIVEKPKLSDADRQKIHQMVEIAYANTLAMKPSEASTAKATLPKTGDNNGTFLSFIGVGLLALVSRFFKKEEERN